VLDTVNLYTSDDHKRKLSLRFLSWFLLKKDIQTASHDSIEDARYALLLYKLWTNFKRDNRLSDVMDDIFFEGHKLVSDARKVLADVLGFQTTGGPRDVDGANAPSRPEAQFRTLWSVDTDPK